MQGAGPVLATPADGPVLAVYAHPDDADVSCGGTLAAWAAAGRRVEVVVCAKGEKGSLDAAADRAELGARRAREVEAAAAALGLAGYHLLDHADGELVNDANLRGQLVQLVRASQPAVVVCPDPTAVFFGGAYLNHRDHRVVGWATLDVVAHEAGNPHYFPAAGEPHRVAEVWLSGTLAPDTWVDIGSTLDTKTAALQCHETQLGSAGEWLRSVVRERAVEAGREAGVRYAEGFRRMVMA